MNNDLLKGVLALAALVLVLVLGSFALMDNGWEKAGCIGRAIGSGISLGNIRSVCGM